jgi:hypothetical protein
LGSHTKQAPTSLAREPQIMLVNPDRLGKYQLTRYVGRHSNDHHKTKRSQGFVDFRAQSSGSLCLSHTLASTHSSSSPSRSLSMKLRDEPSKISFLIVKSPSQCHFWLCHIHVSFPFILFFHHSTSRLPNPVQLQMPQLLRTLSQCR